MPNFLSPRKLRPLALVLSSLALLPAARAENHALIMGISAYPSSPLPGVPKDLANARDIARLIGVPDANIVVKRDAELTAARIPGVIREFGQRVKPGDRIFIYYSGHGTSYGKPDAPGQCEKALVTQDLRPFVKDDFHRLINELSAKADKSFVFLDSCFSGGLVQATHSKALGSRGGFDMPVAKFTSSEPEDPCGKSSNLASKGSRDFGIEAAASTPNYYLLAAAAETEVAIDGGAASGSYATAAVAACLQDTRRADTSGDGAVTLDEVRRCAQGWVDERLRRGQQAYPDFPYTAMTLTHGYGPGGNPVVSFTGGAQPVNTASLAQALYDGRDATRQVALRVDKNPIKVGDYLNLELASDRGGYLTLMVIGSSGRIYQIFPNEKDGDARVEAGRPLAIPRPGKWRMPATPPAGDNLFLALVSDTPDRFKGLGEQAGIFKSLGNSGTSAKGIIERIIKPDAGCASQSRDFGVADGSPPTSASANPCSTGYGAALIKVTEIN